MKFKSCLLIFLGLSFATAATAQDKIYKRDGSVIEGKVLEIGPRTIKYKRAGTSDGPDFVVNKNEIDKIRYENGTEDFIEDMRGPRGPRRPMPLGMDRAGTNTSRERVTYGNNIIGANPLQIMESGESSGTGNGPSVGFGISYERVLDKNGIVSLYLPFYMGFSNTNNYNTGMVTNNNRSYNNFYIMPGLKFYPAGQGMVKYAVGPQATIITGEKYESYTLYDPTGRPIGTNFGTVDRFVFGLAVNNSLNITPTPHLYLGLEMALGFSYINKINDITRGTTGIFQFGFKAGYRF